MPRDKRSLCSNNNGTQASRFMTRSKRNVTARTFVLFRTLFNTKSNSRRTISRNFVPFEGSPPLFTVSRHSRDVYPASEASLGGIPLIYKYFSVASTLFPLKGGRLSKDKIWYKMSSGFTSALLLERSI